MSLWIFKTHELVKLKEVSSLCVYHSCPALRSFLTSNQPFKCQLTLLVADQHLSVDNNSILKEPETLLTSVEKWSRFQQAGKCVNSHTARYVMFSNPL